MWAKARIRGRFPPLPDPIELASPPGLTVPDNRQFGNLIRFIQHGQPDSQFRLARNQVFNHVLTQINQSFFPPDPMSPPFREVTLLLAIFSDRSFQTTGLLTM